MPVFKRSTDTTNARREVLQSSHRWLAQHLAFYQAGKPTGILSFLDTFAAHTHAWTVNNCCFVLSQKPELKVPVTPRIIRSLNQAHGLQLELKADAKPASILIPMTLDATAEGEKPFVPGETNANADEVPMVRVVFRLVPCVYDLRSDVVGGESLALPEEKPEFRNKLLQSVMAKYGPKPSEPEFFSAPHRVELAARQAIVTALTAKGTSLERRIPVSENFRFAAERLGTYVLVKALGQPCSIPIEALNGMHDPKVFLAALGPGMRAVRAVLNPIIGELGLQTARQAALNFRAKAAQRSEDTAAQSPVSIDLSAALDEADEEDLGREEFQPRFDVSASSEEEEDEAVALGLA